MSRAWHRLPGVGARTGWGRPDELLAEADALRERYTRAVSLRNEVLPAKLAEAQARDEREAALAIRKGRDAPERETPAVRALMEQNDLELAALEQALTAVYQEWVSYIL